MPLIIAILIIIVICVVGRENSAYSAKQKEINTKFYRVTNAKLEQERVAYYMQHGYSFDDAYKLAYKNMVDLGLEPCIPKSAYDRNIEGIVESSYCSDIEKYDSQYIDLMRIRLRRQWEAVHKGHKWQEGEEEINAIIYGNIPKHKWQYDYNLSLDWFRSDIIPKGELVLHQKYGACEILDYHIACYTVRVAKTGKIIEGVHSFEISPLSKR